MCQQIYLRFHDCPCQLRYRLDDRDYCHWHQKWNEMRNRAYNSGQWDTRNTSAQYRPLHRRQVWYISPYHESPIDLDKYDNEMKTTETTDKSNTKHTGARCWPDNDKQCETNMVKRMSKNSKAPSRPLSTGCAANFEIFGGSDPGTTAFLD
ncbi:hypothetical protein F4824DRAFT_499497 [Ustulina deusta]|nr:hypothetical protein F4824DRAFT_499497 [Ustulina deusta]